MALKLIYIPHPILPPNFHIISMVDITPKIIEGKLINCPLSYPCICDIIMLIDSYSYSKFGLLYGYFVRQIVWSKAILPITLPSKL